LARQARLSVARLGDTLNAPAEATYNASRSTGAIKFDHVTLRYRVNIAEILQGVNFDMPAVLEVIETPASPAGRVVVAAIIGIYFFSGGHILCQREVARLF
jgi:ATP-binding cassette, subfamily B, bacterial HlyB/CyaB